MPPIKQVQRISFNDRTLPPFRPGGKDLPQSLNNSSANLMHGGPKTMHDSRNTNKSALPLKKTMATKSSMDLF